MIAAIADTHAAIWHLFSDPRLGREASAFIDATISNGGHIGVSAISLAEMVYPIEKARIPPNALEDILAALANPRAVLKQAHIDDKVALRMREIPKARSSRSSRSHHCSNCAATRRAASQSRCAYPLVRRSDDMVKREGSVDVPVALPRPAISPPRFPEPASPSHLPISCRS